MLNGWDANESNSQKLFRMLAYPSKTRHTLQQKQNSNEFQLLMPIKINALSQHKHNDAQVVVEVAQAQAQLL